MSVEKRQKIKDVQQIVASDSESQRFVLVGTYKKEPDQLKWIGRRHLYNYPLSAEEAQQQNAGWSKVKELWLYSGLKDKRHIYTAEFVGIKSRKDFHAEHPDYPKGNGKGHGDFYAVFSVRHKYQPTIDDSVATVRVKDFAKRTPKIAKAIKAYRTGGELGCLLDYLPSELAPLTHEQLRVCEAALQLEFFSLLGIKESSEPRQNVWDKNVEVERSSYLWTKQPLFFNSKKPLSKGKLNVLELFCGCGGTSCGFEMAGYQTEMGIDFLEPAIETFRANHETAAAYLGDIKAIAADDIIAHLPQKVDVVIAGIPCQGFSLNNRKRHDDDKRNSLYLELIRILRKVKPRAVVVENVSGIRSSANGEVVDRIEKGIYEACGLTVRHKLLNAADYGVPQKRARVVFVGVKNKDGFDFEKVVKTNGPGTGRPYVTVKDAIGDLPTLMSGESKMRYSTPPLSDYQRLMRGDEVELWNHSAPTHPQETIEKIANTKQGMPMYPKFRQRIRLKWDEQSPTQVSGGIRPQFQFGHPSQARGLTIRERCRIQSFPDHFRIAGGVVQGRVQTGNAVPPLLAKAVAEALKAYL